YCTKEYVSQIERGRTRPTPEMLGRLAERLSVDRDYLERGVSSGDYERAEALVAKMEALVTGKRYAEAVEAAAEFVPCPEAPELPNDRLRVDILGWRSRCHRRQRDWVSARDDVERALELSQALADPELEANTLFQASLICEREGNWLRARRLAEQARALYEQLDDRVNVGRQLNNLGGFEFLLGNTGKAIERLRQAHELASQIGSTPDAAQALCSL